jgi:hypothetical protein
MFDHWILFVIGFFLLWIFCGIATLKFIVYMDGVSPHMRKDYIPYVTWGMVSTIIILVILTHENCGFCKNFSLERSVTNLITAIVERPWIPRFLRKS